MLNRKVLNSAVAFSRSADPILTARVIFAIGPAFTAETEAPIIESRYRAERAAPVSGCNTRRSPLPGGGAFLPALPVAIHRSHWQGRPA